MRKLIGAAGGFAAALTIGAVLAPAASADGTLRTCPSPQLEIQALVVVDTPCALAKTISVGIGMSTTTPQRSHGYTCKIRRSAEKAHSWVCVKPHTAHSNRTIGWTVLTIG
jgi:hypothetical protein